MNAKQNSSSRTAEMKIVTIYFRTPKVAYGASHNRFSAKCLCTETDSKGSLLSVTRLKDRSKINWPLLN